MIVQFRWNYSSKFVALVLMLINTHTHARTHAHTHTHNLLLFYYYCCLFWMATIFCELLKCNIIMYSSIKWVHIHLDRNCWTVRAWSQQVLVKRLLIHSNAVRAIVTVQRSNDQTRDDNYCNHRIISPNSMTATTFGDDFFILEAQLVFLIKDNFGESD